MKTDAQARKAVSNSRLVGMETLLFPCVMDALAGAAPCVDQVKRN
jgi:hypothetical protein